MAKANLLDLRNRAKDCADLEDSAFISDEMWDSYVNDGYKKLYALILSVHEDYFLTSEIITLIGSQQDYTLDSTFFKIKGVDLNPGGDTRNSITVYPYQWEERNRYKYNQLYSNLILGNSYRYRLMGGDTLRVVPAPSITNSDTMTIWFIPDVTPLALDTDQVVTEELFDEYIILYAARRAYLKEESDSKTLDTLFKETADMVVQTASSRNVNMARRPAQMYDDYEGLMDYRSVYPDGEGTY
jgi:hypothetical protein